MLSVSLQADEVTRRLRGLQLRVRARMACPAKFVLHAALAPGSPSVRL